MGTILFNRSGRIFANPSFTEGISRNFDLFGNQTTYNADLSPEEADARALYSDWASVGDHLILAAQQLPKDAK